MAAHREPPDEDRQRTMDIALGGLGRADELSDLAAGLARLHPQHNTFPGEVLLELGADPVDIAAAAREAPLEFEDIRDRYLPDLTARTKAQHHKRTFALGAVAMLHGGVNPGVLDGVQWWRAVRSSFGRDILCADRSVRYARQRGCGPAIGR